MLATKMPATTVADPAEKMTTSSSARNAAHMQAIGHQAFVQCEIHVLALSAQFTSVTSSGVDHYAGQVLA